MKKNRTNPSHIHVYLNFENLIKIRKCQFRGLSQELFDMAKTMILCNRSKEFSSPQAISKWCHDGAEIPHKTAVKSGQTMKTTKFMDVMWCGPITDSLNLLVIHSDAMSTHYKPRTAAEWIKTRTFSSSNRACEPEVSQKSASSGPSAQK